MKSIQTKIVVLITGALLSLAVILGGASIVTVSKLADADSEIMMNATCNEQMLILNNKLQQVALSVETIYSYAEGELTDPERLKDPVYRDKYLKNIEKLALDITDDTDGAMAVYFHYSPSSVSDGSDGTRGFFWSKTGVDSEIKPQVVTDILDFDPADVEHVGWYYIPVQKGAALWMDPYYNQNVGLDMISYVIPFYADRQLIGVIGMDVDFSLFVGETAKVNLYESGGSNLVNMSTKEVYYLKSGDESKQVLTDTVPDVLAEQLLQSAFSENSNTYSVQGQKVKLVHRTLDNQMKLILYAQAKEIDEERNHLLMTLLGLTFLILIVTILLSFRLVKRITTPLKQLTDAAEQFAKGNWDVDITCNTNDEVKRLTDSIQVMAEKTQEYIKEVNIMAYKDGLTGIKNKSYYLEYVDNVIQGNLKEKTPFALVLFDLNGLKVMNDNRGHEYGDKLLIAASRYICQSYRHSPVFRIGGDEFVTVLMNSDYEIRKELLDNFRSGLLGFEVFEQEDYRLSIASGMAEYGVDGEDYETLFQTADQRMYANKKIMKGERTT